MRSAGREFQVTTSGGSLGQIRPSIAAVSLFFVMALSALVIGSASADLSVGPLSVSGEMGGDPTEGEPLELSVEVFSAYNDTTDVTVYVMFYVDSISPINQIANTGTQLIPGNTTIVGTIFTFIVPAANLSSTAIDSRTYWAVVDPDDSLAEANTANNRDDASVTFKRPELRIIQDADSPGFYPNTPVPRDGTNVDIWVNVTNTGDAPANDVVIRFTCTDCDVPYFRTVTQTVGVSQTIPVNVPWPADGDPNIQVTRDFTISIDRWDDSVYNDGETLNVATTTIPVRPPNKPPTVLTSVDVADGDRWTYVPITFDAAGTIDPDGFVVSYSWSFLNETSQNTVRSTQSFTYTFTYSGTYTLILRVTDDEGAITTDSFSIDVLNREPVADMQVDRATAMTFEAINFDATASYDDDPPDFDAPSGDFLDYIWDFGDGSISFDSSPSHYFDNGSNTGQEYDVILVVSDEWGNQVSRDFTVTIFNRAPEVPTVDLSSNTPPVENEPGGAIRAHSHRVTISFSGQDYHHSPMETDGFVGAYGFFFGDGLDPMVELQGDLTRSINPTNPLDPTWLRPVTHDYNLNNADIIENGFHVFQVTVRAYDDDGAFNDTTFLLNVTNIAPTQSIVAHNVTYNSGDAKYGPISTLVEVEFDATGSFDPDGNITLYVFNFADGSSVQSTSGVVWHEFTDDSRYWWGYDQFGGYSERPDWDDYYGSWNVTVTVYDDHESQTDEWLVPGDATDVANIIYSYARMNVTNRAPIASFSTEAGKEFNFQTRFPTEYVINITSFSRDLDTNPSDTRGELGYYWRFGEGWEVAYYEWDPQSDEETLRGRSLADNTTITGPEVPFQFIRTPDAYKVEWRGVMLMGFNQTLTFAAETDGMVRMSIDGSEVFQGVAQNGVQVITGNFTSPNWNYRELYFEYWHLPGTTGAVELYAGTLSGANFNRIELDQSRVSLGLAFHSSPSISFPDGDREYEVWLQIQDDDNYTINKNILLDIRNRLPTPDLQISNATISPGVEVVFNASLSSDRDGAVVAYRFLFGDGTESGWIDSPLAAHTYNVTEMDYDVQVFVRDDDFGVSVSSASQTLFVQNREPLIELDIRPDQGDTGSEVPWEDPLIMQIAYNAFPGNFSNYPSLEPVIFDASNTTDPNHDPLSFIWEFGYMEESDGAILFNPFRPWDDTRSGKAVSYTFPRPGIAVIHLVVNDTYTDTEGYFVMEIQNRPPRAVQIANISTIMSNQSITFTSVSEDPDGSIDLYIWDFGDGNLTIWERVWKEDPDQSYLSLPWDILGGDGTLVSNSTGPRTYVHSDEINETVDISRRYWLREDYYLTGDAQPSLSHRYKDYGVYNVTLWVRDGYHIYRNTTMQVMVLNRDPVADAGRDRVVEAGEEVILSAFKSEDEDGKIVNYTWDLGDGTIENGIMVTHTYSLAGTYLVKLLVEDEGGERSVTSIEVTVERKMEIDLTPASASAVIPSGGSAYYIMTVTVTGNDFELLDITTENTRGGWRVDILTVTNQSMPDINANGKPDTGILDGRYAAKTEFLVKVTPSSRVQGRSEDTTKLIVTSTVDPDLFDDTVLRTSIERQLGIEIFPDRGDVNVQGETLRYNLTVVNFGNVPDPVNFEVKVSPDSETDMSWRLIDPLFDRELSDTNNDGFVDMGSIAPFNESKRLQVEVTTPLHAPVGSKNVLQIWAYSGLNETYTDNVRLITKVLKAQVPETPPSLLSVIIDTILGFITQNQLFFMSVLYGSVIGGVVLFTKKGKGGFGV